MTKEIYKRNVSFGAHSCRGLESMTPDRQVGMAPEQKLEASIWIQKKEAERASWK